MTDTLKGMLTEEEFIQHMAALTDEDLEHAGVKGMRWGQRKDTGGAFGNTKSGVSQVRNYLLPGLGNKQSRFTNSAAAAKNAQAGKLAVTSILSGIGALTLKSVGYATGNKGASIVGDLLLATAGGTGLAATVVGARAVNTQKETDRG
jgi:hypothetical protein